MINYKKFNHLFFPTGKNYFGGRIKNISKWNTGKFAEFIQNAVGGVFYAIFL